MAANEKTVLVVDDDEAIRAIATKVIQSRGYRTVTASDGNEALSILKSGTRVDLMVLDVVMPGLDGLRTIEEARKLGFAETPVVLLTAQSKNDDILGGYRKGASFYLTKPLRPAYLVNAVDYLIGDLSAEERTRLELLL
jgi:CheY-like chemotaxis protein